MDDILNRISLWESINNILQELWDEWKKDLYFELYNMT